MLAAGYDALKAVNPAITVIGVGLSPRGNDIAEAADNPSTSPVRCLRDIGAAYRASGRTKPIMDELAFHAYPEQDSQPFGVASSWPKVGLVDLARLKQAVWDAFNGTAQPTFAETGQSLMLPALRLRIAEVGWQVGVVPVRPGRLHRHRERRHDRRDQPGRRLHAGDPARSRATRPSNRSTSSASRTRPISRAGRPG